MLEFLDTQIISYAMKGRYDKPIQGKAISSVVAKEFLLLHGVTATQATYYLPHLGSRHSFPLIKAVTRGRNRPFSRFLTDSIILDLGAAYGTVVEYSDIAIANLISKGDTELFNAATEFLGKDKQRVLKKRLLFLLENDIRCIPLSKSAVLTTLDLLSEFQKTHNPKPNFRNTLNDLMIFATAITSSGQLTTVDSELVRFMTRYDVRVLTEAREIVTVDFTHSAYPGADGRKESKGYINQGWQVRFRNSGYG
jgi:hypothetical protein